MADKRSITLKNQAVDISSPLALAEFATTLKQFIVEQKLYTNIKGKNYSHVEAWEFVGASIGVLPVVKSVERVIDISDEAQSEIKYRAEVALIRTSTGDKVGYGVAICSNKENGRSSQDEYVIASMAQTRAVGKAYRNGFAWLLKMAGYEATPAEEMSDEVIAKKTADKEAIRSKQDADN